jgi:hypothetical protein
MTVGPEGERAEREMRGRDDEKNSIIVPACAYLQKHIYNTDMN